MNSGHLLWCPQKIELCHSREFFKADQDSKADRDAVDGMPYIVKVNKNLKCMTFSPRASMERDQKSLPRIVSHFL